MLWKLITIQVKLLSDIFQLLYLAKHIMSYL